MRYILLFTLFSSIIFCQSFYYVNSKKVFINKKTPTSRAIKTKTCYNHIGVDDNICLSDEIVINIDKKYLLKILTKYSLVLKKELLSNLFVVQVSDFKNTLKISHKLYNEKNIKYAYPNFENVVKFRTSTDPIKISDPEVNKAWHLKNTGQGHNYKIGADIKAEKAWLFNSGDTIRIGIIDDGIEISHPDIVYTDGYSIKNPGARNPNHYNTNIAHHGTKAASLIVGKNNSVGSVGIAYSSLLYVVNVDGSSKVSEIVRAFTWLKEQKVDVISNSWGTYHVPDPIVQVVEDLLKTGREGKGINIVFAVGNDSRNLDDDGIFDESEIPGVIAVGASSPFDNRYIKNNYGKNLTLLAPGVDMYVARQDATNKQIIYTTETGTSLSAPVVAGGIAIMLSANKTITTKAIKEILQNTSDKIATNEYSYDVDGRNNYYGFGRLNLEDAVREASVWYDKSKITKKEKEFVLDINRGWNLLSIPISKVIHQRDFVKYFGYGHKLVTLQHGSYNHYAKMIFPEDGFYMHSLSATTVTFKGYDYNASFENTPIREGWNLLGVGQDVNITTIRSLIEDTDYLYLFRNKKFVTELNESRQIKRGEGFFIYKLAP